MSNPYQSRADDYRKHTRLFWHEREVTHGEARVIYAEPMGQLGRWFLPGGHTTTDPIEARAAAMVMDGLIKALAAQQATVIAAWRS